MWQLAALLGIGLGILNHKDKFGSEAPEFPIQPFDARYSEKESSDDWAMRQKGYQSMRFQNNYDAEQVPSRKVRSISGKSVKLRPLQKDRNLKPKEARDRLEISAEDFEAQEWDSWVSLTTQCSCGRTVEPYEYKLDENNKIVNVKYKCNCGGGICRARHYGNIYSFPCRNKAEYRGLCSHHAKCDRCNVSLKEDYEYFGRDEGHDDGFCNQCYDDTGRYGAETFNAAVLHKKPKGYVGKAVAMDALMTQARIEEAMLQLETAVKLGLISEDEIMEQLQQQFGSEEYAGNYMVPADIKSIARSVATLQKKAKADQNTPEWWKSKLSVVAAELDDLTDFFDYAEDAGML